MEALIAQRKMAVAKVEAEQASVDRLDAEIRIVAAQLAGGADARHEIDHDTHMVGRNGSNGANGYVVPNEVPLAPAPTSPERARLAPRKLELLRLLLKKPETSLTALAIRIYGNEGRASRSNVTAYCEELRAEQYIEPGSRPDTFRLTEKGRAMCQ
jgi:hypothetical protein